MRQKFISQKTSFDATNLFQFIPICYNFFQTSSSYYIFQTSSSYYIFQTSSSYYIFQTSSSYYIFKTSYSYYLFQMLAGSQTPAWEPGIFDRSHALRGNAYLGAPAPRNPPPESVKHGVRTPERGNHDQIVRLYKFTPNNCPLTPAYPQRSGCPDFDRSHAPRGNACLGAPVPRNPPPERSSAGFPRRSERNHDQSMLK
jgi:hypothetical protein